MVFGFHGNFCPLQLFNNHNHSFTRFNMATVFVAEMHRIFCDFFFELKPINGCDLALAPKPRLCCVSSTIAVLPTETAFPNRVKYYTIFLHRILNPLPMSS